LKFLIVRVPSCPILREKRDFGQIMAFSVRDQIWNS
jgi:hypothetical protein